MFDRISRRRFLASTSALTAAAATSRVFAAPNILSERSPNSTLNIAGIGVGGRGGSHVQSSLKHNLVAACDASQGSLDGCLRRAEKSYKDQNVDKPLPKTFRDYRAMFDKMHRDIDAVFVATPDNHHAPASMMAIKLGKHVYCEKPLTHDIYEARQLMLAAREHKVATQMGNQGRAEEGWRQLCEMIWAGAIGNVREVHIWTDRPGIPKRFWWPQGGTRPAGSDPVPASLSWNVWLGPAPERPFLDKYKQGEFKGRSVYQPFVWRGWWDFGTGALGDIGCHAISGTFSALKIEYATAVELLSDTGDTTSEMFPRASTIRWQIPARGEMPPCQLYWYDGGHYPPRDVAEIPEGQEFPSNGKIVVGDRGKINVQGTPKLMPSSKTQDFTMPEPTIPRCESNHFEEWVTACKGGRPAFSNFDHAGPLTELVLLGNLAIKAGVGKTVEWDGPNMRCANLPELNQLVRRHYRDDWTL